MKRVVCLYRVSTKGQVEKDDIPMQRKACHEFCDARDDWFIVKEYTEKGISGFKVSAEKRDVIMEIRQDAIDGAFDALLVYMFDRLGRRDDETPFLVEWFDKQGIEIWSCQEGQQKFDEHIDKLLNYIRFWQASGESIKTSMRMTTKQQQMVEEGRWRGGTKPYGYKLVHNGRLGKKNRQLFDLAIDEAESSVVREIFRLYNHEGMGIHQLANHLNKTHPSEQKLWAPQTVRSLLKNPIYAGVMRFNDRRSPVIESLRIISDSEFGFAQRIMADRVTRRERVDELGEKLPTKTSLCGASLLSGILYCGHCEHKLVGTYHSKTNKSGKTYRPVYRCYNGATIAKGCDGQRTYSALKIEEAVLETVRAYFDVFNHDVDSVWKEQARLQLKRGSKDRAKQAEAALARLRNQYEKLKEEMVKTLTGESIFDAETVKENLDKKKQAIAEAEAHLQEVKQTQQEIDERLRTLIEQYNQVKDWADIFDSASNDEKKMILARLIKKITVDRDYRINIYFLITLEDFRQERETLEVLKNVTFVDVLRVGGV